LDRLLDLLDTLLKILNYNLLNIELSQVLIFALQFTTHAHGLLVLLSLTNTRVPVSNSGRSPSWFPELCIATATVDLQCIH
jgi:hypothetical protein